MEMGVQGMSPSTNSTPSPSMMMGSRFGLGHQQTGGLVNNHQSHLNNHIHQHHSSNMNHQSHHAGPSSAMNVSEEDEEDEDEEDLEDEGGEDEEDEQQRAIKSVLLS